MSFNIDFSGKTVVITGGAQGIGFEISKNFLQLGANVSIWDYNEDTLKAATQELSDFSSQLKTCTVDVTTPESCNEAAKKTGKTDVLINNAGITRDKSFGKMSLSPNLASPASTPDPRKACQDFGKNRAKPSSPKNLVSWTFPVTVCLAV